MAETNKQLTDTQKLLNDTRIQLNETTSRFYDYSNNLVKKWINYKLFTESNGM